MIPYRVRIRRLPGGHYAVEVKNYWWSSWTEENLYSFRATTKAEAIKRAALILNPEIIDQETILREAEKIKETSSS